MYFEICCSLLLKCLVDKASNNFEPSAKCKTRFSSKAAFKANFNLIRLMKHQPLAFSVL